MSEPDWAHTRVEMKAFVLHRMKNKYSRPVDDADVEACAQDAVVRLYQWWCREREAGRPIESFAAMMNQVANFAAIDLVRELVKRGRFVTIDGDDGDDSGDRVASIDPERTALGPAPIHRDAPERLRHLVLAWFDAENKPCHDLGIHYYSGQGWQAVSQELGLGIDTVRQRWSRCVKQFREFLTENPGVEDWVFEEGA
ncbi:MAG TPA: hypothetical protein VN896_03000 [Methylomirabilota bacterium]|nr:hypothetical protein [Methylomirabilota bacterium]